jgi:hypothetical protein
MPIRRHDVIRQPEGQRLLPYDHSTGAGYRFAGTTRRNRQRDVRTFAKNVQRRSQMRPASRPRRFAAKPAATTLARCHLRTTERDMFTVLPNETRTFRLDRNNLEYY